MPADTGSFKKAVIEPEGKEKITALFNPTQYTVEKANQIAEVAIPGLEAPVLQYVHGNTRSLTMELFFDTYEERTDVRDHTDKVYNLLGIKAETHVPPVCTITWGGFSFTGILSSVSGQFTLFLPDGTPARAVLSVTFKEFIEVEVLVKETVTQSSDHRKQIYVQRGDRLDLIAHREYGDAAMWRPLAIANDLDDPSRLQPGSTLVVPRLN